jgi:hypothetical protein
VGFQAILADGSVIAPAVDVLAGVIKASLANERYRGVSGTCPHCQQLRDQQAGTDNPLVQAALSIADLTVRFRRAQLEGDQMVRIMHFAHARGFLASPGACMLCRDSNLAHHGAAVQVIGRWAQQHWPGAMVKAEMQVVAPGTPPTLFRPDVSVIDAAGRRVACIEYQRTKESFESFKARDEARCREFGEVLWFFHAGAYGKSWDHRDYLADRGRRFFRTWTERESGQLMREEGERPTRRQARNRDHDLAACSEASLMRVIDPPDRTSRPAPALINTTLDLGMVSRQATPAQTRSNRKAHSPILTVTDRVRAAVKALAAEDEFHSPCTTDLLVAQAMHWVNPREVQAWDSARHATALGIGEIQRALRALRG